MEGCQILTQSTSKVRKARKVPEESEDQKVHKALRAKLARRET